MTPEEQALSQLRGQVVGIVLGSLFVFAGVGALAIALLRRKRQIGLLVWFALFSGLYGLRMLAQAPAAFALLPEWLWPFRGYVVAVITYVILLPALFFWLELTKGTLRRFIQISIVVAAVIAVCGLFAAAAFRAPEAFMLANSVLAIVFVFVVGPVNAVPSLARRWMIEPSRVLSAGALVLAAAVLANNLGQFFPMPDMKGTEAIGFAVFVFSLGYVAAQRVLTAERRLLTIENELDIAREIQRSILPTSVPQLQQLRVAASYLPMTSVAGDFYEFIHLDEKHAGFLVADVSGHGVPAALIASMIKVAMHSVAARAEAPAEVLSGLNGILSHQLRGQFVTAAYLFIDLEHRSALYSGAGHPPLLYWNAPEKQLQKIESNGLLFGVLKETEYPVRELQLRSGDRFLLYTDGLVEAENAAGEAFGDRQLQEMIAANASLPATELSAQILEKLGQWQSQSGTQQDDVTLIVIDVP
jgi:sigma-B regulation protein RsbU (phosphoserine phosphatase)